MKLAVITHDTYLFHFVRNSFPSDCQVAQFDTACSVAPVLSTNEFNGLLVDSKIDRNLAHDMSLDLSARQIPLIVFRDQNEATFPFCMLESTADEIVLLPLNASEVYLRTLYAVRRFATDSFDVHDHEISFANLRLNRRTGNVKVKSGNAESTIRLTSREFAVLWTLIDAPDQYLTRKQLAGAIWANSEQIISRTLEQHIYTLRKKLSMSALSGLRIRTVYGQGYQLESDFANSESEIVTAAA
jgi:DNA-binding response OmpR family regulator